MKKFIILSLLPFVLVSQFVVACSNQTKFSDYFEQERINKYNNDFNNASGNILSLSTNVDNLNLDDIKNNIYANDANYPSSNDILNTLEFTDSSGTKYDNGDNYFYYNDSYSSFIEEDSSIHLAIRNQIANYFLNNNFTDFSMWTSISFNNTNEVDIKIGDFDDKLDIINNEVDPTKIDPTYKNYKDESIKSLGMASDVNGVAAIFEQSINNNKKTYANGLPVILKKFDRNFFIGVDGVDLSKSGTISLFCTLAFFSFVVKNDSLSYIIYSNKIEFSFNIV